jgi:hypothetical protein
LFIGSRHADTHVYVGVLHGHWGIENNLHRQLDVLFGEDDSSISNRNSAENVALLREFALGLLKQHPEKDSIATKGYKAVLSAENLIEILIGK